MADPKTDAFRLLAVDDEEPVLGLYRDILSPELPFDLSAGGLFGPVVEQAALPFDLTLCSQAEQAVSTVRKSLEQGLAFSVAFLDVRMPPGKDGVWAAEEIRRLDPDIEIVMVTAYSDVDFGELNRRVPPAEKLIYLQKPLHPQELRQFARHLCAKWQAEQEVRRLTLQLHGRIDAQAKELTIADKRSRVNEAVKREVLRELKASEERFRTLFEEDITGDFVAEPDGRLKACNKAFARLFGYPSPDEAMRVNILVQEAPQAGRKPIRELLAERKSITGLETAFLRRDLSSVYVVGNVIPKLDAQGQLAEFIGYFHDITERIKLEERLRIAEKMEAIGTLAGGIAHDFNNILGVITGYAEIILENTQKATAGERRVREILRACRRAKDLINQILNFSRQSPQEKKALRVTPLIKETLKLIRPSIGKDIEVRESYRTESDTVLADPSQVHQIILNLCTNAAQAMRETGGKLEVGVTDVRLDEAAAAEHPDLSEGSYVLITVSDTGPGIAPDIKDKIFDPFFTTKKPGEGTGMGLAVVHGVVKQHGGAVMVHSEPGKGATFQVLLPQGSLGSEDESGLEAPVPAGSGRVLLVDDEAALIDIGKEMLESLGYEVTARTSGLEALEAFRYKPEAFDLIITDQNMPNISGLGLAEKVLAIRPGMPVILCTGFSEVVSHARARDLGVSEVLMKPMLKRQLAEAIQRAMGRTES